MRASTLNLGSPYVIRKLESGKTDPELFLRGGIWGIFRLYREIRKSFRDENSVDKRLIDEFNSFGDKYSEGISIIEDRGLTNGALITLNSYRELYNRFARKVFTKFGVLNRKDEIDRALVDNLKRDNRDDKEGREDRTHIYD